ncbi:MAG: S8 family serine peptidase [Candidatus Heimdallarchaeota archaeon]|nr:S8 family serine peptidase [Candidatus Heimdallarchaeota archaeon]
MKATWIGIIILLSISVFPVSAQDTAIPVTDNIEYNLSKFNGGLDAYAYDNIPVSNQYQDQILVLSKSESELDGRFYPRVQLGNNYLHFLPTQSPSDLRRLAINPSVLSMYPNMAMTFSSENNPHSPISDSFVAKDILDVQRVWDQFNITGDGVIISIVDSGVDFGISDLEDSPLLLPSGITASYDATGAGIAIANTTMTATMVGNRTELQLEDNTLFGRIGESNEFISNNDLGIELQNLDISGIAKPSISGNYKLGLIIHQGYQEHIPLQIFLFILTDSVKSGEYDTMYIDFDTSLGLSLSYNGIIFETGTRYLSLVDWSMEDEIPIDFSNPIANRDIDGDGVADVSAGALTTAYVPDTSLIDEYYVRGIDPSGVVALMYDAIGHGTLSAGAAASRGQTNYALFDDASTQEIENTTRVKLPGSAPGAKLIATKGMTLTDFIMGWLWSAGMELSVTGLMTQTNEHHVADLTSNSWGDGSIASTGSVKGMDIWSLLLDMMSVPDLLYTNYPGMLFVVSSGNGGSGIGTIATPATASMAITVGASNNYEFLNNKGRNDVAFFSARGPTPYGIMKPDIVTPGNTGFTPQQVSVGLGNGTYAAGTFGGTSEACPRGAGVVALIIQALKEKGRTVDLGSVRTILKSTAKDLGFPTSSQGAGLAQGFPAIDAIYDGPQLIVSSTQASKIAGDWLQAAFVANFDEVEHPLVTNPQPDTFIMADHTNMQSGLEIVVSFGNGTLVNVSSYDVQTVQMAEIRNSTGTFKSASAEQTIISLDSMLPSGYKNADLLQISLSLDETSWNNLVTMGVSVPSMQLYDYGGTIVNDVIKQKSWIQQLYSGHPGSDFKNEPRLRFTDTGFTEEVPGWTALNYLLFAQTYSYVTWELDRSTSIGQLTLNASLNDAFQEGMLIIGDQHFPIIISSINKVGYGQEAMNYPVEETYTAPYTLNEAYGTLDWNYRPENGDFRFYQFSVPDNATFLAIQVAWEAENVVPDAFLFNGTGHLVALSDVTYLGGGTYESYPSEFKKQNLLVEVDSNNFTLLLHFAQMPFDPVPVQFTVFSRYLTRQTLPIPEGQFDQDLNNVTGDLILTVDNYALEDFPELKINKLEVLVAQGRNGSLVDTIDAVDFIQGVTTDFDMVENYYPIDLVQGEKVDLELEWEGMTDLDLLVLGPDSLEFLEFDLLQGQGLTPSIAVEYASFAALETGTYFIYVDVVVSEEIDVTYTLNWESRKGPTLLGDNELLIPSDIFPNGEYELQIIYHSNFGVNFLEVVSSMFDNHLDFTSSLVTPSGSSILSDLATVSWQASVAVTADVFIVRDTIEISIGQAVTANSINFDTTKYANGEAIIRIYLTDGVYTHMHEVSVIIENRNPSSLLPTTTTTGSLSAFSSISLLMVLFLPIIRRRKEN